MYNPLVKTSPLADKAGGIKRGKVTDYIKGLGITYLLRATFTAANQSLIDAQVLDTVTEGVDTGSLTVQKNGKTISFDIVSNEVVFSAETSPAGLSNITDTTGRSRAIGLALFGTFLFDVTNQFLAGGFGWANNSNPNSGEFNLNFNVRNNGQIQARETGSVNVDITAYSSATEYQLCLIVGGYNSKVPYQVGDIKANFTDGGRFYIKGGVYTNWTLLWMTTASTITTVYASINFFTQTGTFKNIKVVENISSVFIPTFLDTSVLASDTFTHDADFMGEMLLSALPSAGLIDVYFRTDWAIQISSTGGIELKEDADGTPISRGTGTGVTATSVIKWKAEDEEIKIYSDNVVKITYSAAVANKTTTGGSINSLGTGGAISHIAGWPRTGYLVLDTF